LRKGKETNKELGESRWMSFWKVLKVGLGNGDCARESETRKERLGGKLTDDD